LNEILDDESLKKLVYCGMDGGELVSFACLFFFQRALTLVFLGPAHRRPMGLRLQFILDFLVDVARLAEGVQTRPHPLVE